MNNVWNLVASGPSIAHLKPAHILDGPVVSVNRAMLGVYAAGIELHFAAFADSPKGAWEICNLEAHWKPPTIVWCITRNLTQRVPINPNKQVPEAVKARIVQVDGVDCIEMPGPPVISYWDQLLPASIGLRLMPHANVPDPDDPKGRARQSFTTLCAFAGILRYEPRTIRILCMDMAGSWIAGKTEEECHRIDMQRDNLNRWRHERRTMSMAVKEARTKGVRIEIMRPEPDGSLTDLSFGEEKLEPEVESLDGAVVH